MSKKLFEERGRVTPLCIVSEFKRRVVTMSWRSLTVVSILELRQTTTEIVK
jgi:hypothetical protein